MTATSLAETTWRDAEIGGSAWIGVDAGGAELRSRRGATVDRGQLMELAPSFAAALGLTVTD